MGLFLPLRAEILFFIWLIVICNFTLTNSYLMLKYFCRAAEQICSMNFGIQLLTTWEDLHDWVDCEQPLKNYGHQEFIKLCNKVYQKLWVNAFLSKLAKKRFQPDWYSYGINDVFYWFQKVGFSPCYCHSHVSMYVSTGFVFLF